MPQPPAWCGMPPFFGSVALLLNPSCSSLPTIAPRPTCRCRSSKNALDIVQHLVLNSPDRVCTALSVAVKQVVARFQCDEDRWGRLVRAGLLQASSKRQRGFGKRTPDGPEGLRLSKITQVAAEMARGSAPWPSLAGLRLARCGYCTTWWAVVQRVPAGGLPIETTGRRPASSPP